MSSVMPNAHEGQHSPNSAANAEERQKRCKVGDWVMITAAKQGWEHLIGRVGVVIARCGDEYPECAHMDWSVALPGAECRVAANDQHLIPLSSMEAGLSVAEEMDLGVSA